MGKKILSIEDDLKLWAQLLKLKKKLKHAPYTAIYDNPVTMMREAWANETLMNAVNSDAIRDYHNPIFPKNRWPFYIPVSKFEPCSFTGDLEAVPLRYLEAAKAWDKKDL